MLWFHPVLQALATLLALWVMEMGVRRTLFSHFGKRKVVFPWKRHVLYGKIVLITWLAGLAIGLLFMRQAYGVWGVSGPHVTVAVVMAALIAFGYVSGHILDKVKKRRKVLNILHGLNNTALLALALYQAWSGWQLVRMYLLHMG